jgi:uncharacterized secreted protein with C-terminal beta-propeller domain
MKRTVALATLALLLSLAAAATADARRHPNRLRAFGSCAQLVRYGVSHAGPFRTLPGPIKLAPGVTPQFGAGEGGAAPPAAAPDSSAREGEGTNVQEAGIDEPDVVKTDGRTLFAVNHQTLRAVDVSGGTPRVIDALKLPPGEVSLLLHGSRLLVMVSGYGGGAVPIDAAPAGPAILPAIGFTGTTKLLEVDVSDPAHLRVSRTLDVDGRVLSSRLHAGTARVVIASTPMAIAPPLVAGAAHAARLSRRVGRWLPRGRFRSNVTGRRWTRSLVGCRAMRHPTSFSGLDTLTILTIDLDKGLWATDRDAIMSSADTVYASADSLYVATQRWTSGGADGATTSIHRFDVSSPTATTYEATGDVPGHLLNQFSLSEQGKVLRVATTAGDNSESRVTTLTQRGARLEELGHVGGLGHGERIYAVRFMGDLGYVVTFRQVDPLYTIDLSDPAHPAVRGQLEIDGYSAYLHPVGPGLLLGVGQATDAAGHPLGEQVSLFDVSDPAHPVRLARHALGADTSSEVDYDHHAFLWWPTGQLAVLPLIQWGKKDGGPAFDGSVGLRVDRGGITEVGRVVDPPAAGPKDTMTRRAVVAGGALWTVSDAGLARVDTGTLARTAWVPFE